MGVSCTIGLHPAIDNIFLLLVKGIALVLCIDSPAFQSGLFQLSWNCFGQFPECIKEMTCLRMGDEDAF